MEQYGCCTGFIYIIKSYAVPRHTIYGVIFNLRRTITVRSVGRVVGTSFLYHRGKLYYGIIAILLRFVSLIVIFSCFSRKTKESIIKHVSLQKKKKHFIHNSYVFVNSVFSVYLPSTGYN